MTGRLERPLSFCTQCLQRYPDSSTGISPHRIVYGTEMHLPVDLVFGGMGRERPEVHCPYEYV